MLGFIVFERGIEANPEKIATIRNIELITNPKGAQKLMGCMALSRFISWLGEHGMPLKAAQEVRAVLVDPRDAGGL